MDDLNKKIKDKIKENDIKIQKVFHSSFSDQKLFDKGNTFSNFNVEKYGAFHGACDLEENDKGRQIAENRTFVKIIEDANMMKGVHPSLMKEILADGNVDFDLLEKETGYKIGDQFKNPIMIEAEISYSKALVLNENRTGQWTPSDIIREILQTNDGDPKDASELPDGFTEDDVYDYFEDNLNLNGIAFIDLDSEDYGDDSYKSQEYKETLFVRDWLESKGYDAIKYENEFEGKSECIMSFRPENINVTDSYCLKHLLENNNKNILKNEEDVPKTKRKNRPS